MFSRPGKHPVPIGMHRVTPPMAKPPSGLHAVMYAPTVNGRTNVTLGYQDLLEPRDKKVYVSCSSDNIIYPPADAELYWGVDDKGEPRRLANLHIASETDSITLEVAGDKIAGTQDPIGHDFTGDGTHAVTVRIVYGGGTYDESPPTSAIVKCSEPGGPDPIGATKDINENLPKPTVTPASIPDLATPVWIIIEGYDVRYIGDTIRYEWGGPRNYFLHDVTTTDGPLSVQVPPEIIARVGGGRVPVSYYITDIAGNWSKYAPYAEPLVDIDPGTMLAPQLLYADGTSVEVVVNLETLGSDHLILRVPVRNLSEDDVVNAWWEATLASGEVVSYESADLIFDDEENQLYLDVRIDNAIVLEAASGTVRIWYVRQGDEALSKRRTYRVSNHADIVLPPPVVPQATGGELDPFAHGAYIRVEVLFDERFMFNGTIVKLIVTGDAGGSSLYWDDQFALSSGDLGQPAVFFCPAAEIQKVVNGNAIFQYEVSQPTFAMEGQPVRPYAVPVSSEPLTLRIRRAGAAPDYTAPNVIEVIDGALDPDAPQARVTIPTAAQGGPPPGTDVTLSWRGVASYTTEGKVPSTGQLEFRIAGAAYIKPNDGSQVVVSYADKAGRRSDDFTFDVGEVDRFELDPTDHEMLRGESYQRVAKGKAPIVYESSNPGVVSVDTDSGIVTALRVGGGNISATDGNGKWGRYHITVSLSDKPLQYDTSPTSIPIGTSYTRTASGGVEPYAYSSSNPTVVSVDASTGLVRGLRPGSGNISVIDAAGASARHHVTVQR